MASKQNISFTVNGGACSVQSFPMARLLDVLREDLGLTGTKEGCGEGECGACAVLIDGVLSNSCLIPMMQAQGCSVRTIEGLSEGPAMDRIQTAFLECGGAQCGMCTPGMIMATYHLLEHDPHPSRDAIREGLAGNLCRCTGYQKIFAAVEAAARV